MNLNCFYCGTPFTLTMDQKTTAVMEMHAQNLHHYDARCPRCGRANAISRERLEMFTPGWEEAILAGRPLTPTIIYMPVTASHALTLLRQQLLTHVWRLGEDDLRTLIAQAKALAEIRK